MKNRFILGALFFVVTSFIFSSCATLKKEECLAADWYNIGYEDGLRGHQSSRVALHRKACSAYGVVPDLSLYQKGRSEGLVEYCTPHKGYLQGLKGRSYNDVCRGGLKDPFHQAYLIGRDIYLFQKQIRHEQREQDRLEQEMENLDLRIKEKEDSLSTECQDSNKCTEMLNDIRALDREKRKLKSALYSKKEQIEAMKQTLEDMKNQAHF